MLSVLITRDMCNERKKCTPPGGARLQTQTLSRFWLQTSDPRTQPRSVTNMYILVYVSISVYFPCLFRQIGMCKRIHFSLFSMPREVIFSRRPNPSEVQTDNFVPK